MQEAHLVGLYRAGEQTVSELEELFGVTRSTAYRAVRRAANGATGPADAPASADTASSVEPEPEPESEPEQLTPSRRRAGG